MQQQMHLQLLKPRKSCKLFTSKPLVIPVFIPHSGCPHLCAFCNQSIITEPDTNSLISSALPRSSELPSAEDIEQTVNNFLAYKGGRKEVELAFFGGNFLGLEPDEIIFLLSSAQELVREGKIDSIRFSTRPDTITKERLELIEPYSISTVEIGVQSMSDSVLKMARRGHRAEETVRAASLLRDFQKLRTIKSSSSINISMKPFTVGMQMLVGLPGENNQNLHGFDTAIKTQIDSTSALDTAEKIATLHPDFVRIYPLIVLEGSLVAKWYRQGLYQPMSIDSCVNLVKKIFQLFEQHNIPVIRMGLQASDLLQDKLSMIAGPWHPAFGHLVYSEIFFDKVVDLIDREFSHKNTDIHDKTDTKAKTITLNVHPASVSRLRGDRNNNIKRLKELYPSVDFTIRTDESLDKNQITL